MSDVKQPPKKSDDPGATLRRLADFLDEEPITDEEIQETVKASGIDMDEWAKQTRERVAAALAKSGKAGSPAQRLLQHDRERSKPRRAPEPARPRAEQIARIHELMARARAKDVTVAAHFRKLEDATDAQLAEIATSLAELVEDEGKE